MIRALAALLLLLTTVAHAEPLAKKDRERAGKSTKHADAPVPGRKAAKLVNLYNTWTHEWLAIDPAAPPAQPIANRFLRDHYTNEARAMEPRLVQILGTAAANFRSETVMIVSGFRHPKFNLLLRKKGHQVARDSHHSAGDAVDFYVPKVTTERLHAWAIAQKIGGVGLYLDSGFIHMDTGKVRAWSGE